MRLRIFQSQKGDCLLLTGKNGANVLIDGGMRASYEKHVAPYLGGMRQRRQNLDLVYVSHIDQDHIAGILKLCNDEVLWRVYDYHRKSGRTNTRIKKPSVPRPPKILNIWHNSFHEQIEDNNREIEEMLAASSRILIGLGEPQLHSLAWAYQNLATSKREAHNLSRRIGARQLNIPLNRQFGNKLIMMRRRGSSTRVGNLSITVIGPDKKDLNKLREEWNEWLNQNREFIEGLQKRSKKDEKKMGQVETAFTDFLVLSQLGKREKVTTPNLASLMLLVEEAGKSVLLTGDGHAHDVLKGLKAAGKLRNNKNLHVNVLKIMHHGSEHNTTDDFPKSITADHYVFCGNGAHHNPELEVVEAFAKSRIGSASERGENPEVGKPFKFWFNTSPNAQGLNKKYKEHMKEVQALVKKLAKSGKKQMKYSFFDTSSRYFNV